MPTLAGLAELFKRLKERCRENHRTTADIDSDLLRHGIEIMVRYNHKEHEVKTRWIGFRQASADYIAIAETQIEQARLNQHTDVKKLMETFDSIRIAAASRGGARWYDEVTRRAEVIVLTLEASDRLETK